MLNIPNDIKDWVFHKRLLYPRRILGRDSTHWKSSRTFIHLFFSPIISGSMELTLDQLKQYDGTDPSKPIYIGVRGRIFDVSTAASFYGPGGSYAMFAGKDASRALAKMSKNDEDVIGSLDGLTDKELGILADWEKKLKLSTQLSVLSLLNLIILFLYTYLFVCDRFATMLVIIV